MSRSIDQTLIDALANQQGEIILRVNTWADHAAYNAAPSTPEHTWVVLKFDIYHTSAKAVLVTENDYTVSDFTVFIIERGATVSGTEYTVESGLYFITKYKEDFGTITIEGSSFPPINISIAGDNSYETVINAYMTAIGKAASYQNADDPWQDYQFLETGKTLTLNKASLFENLLRQKYGILMSEIGPETIRIFNLDSFKINGMTTLCWSPQLNLFMGFGDPDNNGEPKSSPNGIVWTTRTPAEDNYWTGIAWSPALNLFCAVSIAGTNRVQTSPDGITWTARTASQSAQWRSIAWSPSLNLFCAVGTSGAIMTSPDGITWTNRTAGSSADFNSICWSPELAIFCAVAQAGTNLVQTSTDGITWTNRTASEANGWQSVTWAPSLTLFCAVSSTGTNRVMTSPDGITWTARAAAEANIWQSICWSPSLSLFCAVSSTGTNRVMTSPDGITWTARTPGASAYVEIVWSPELAIFCAVANTGNNHVITSADGITWTSRHNPIDYVLQYTDGPTSYMLRDQSEVYFSWIDETGTLHTDGDTTKPQWNLGYLESTASPPITREDPYYKIFLMKAPVRLDLTDGDVIHFIPYWSVDPTQTIDAMMRISEHLDFDKTPSWWQEIKSIVLFNKTDGAISNLFVKASEVEIVNTGFIKNLDDTVTNIQILADKLDDLNPLFTRTLTSNLVLKDTQSLLALDYIDTATFDIDLQGDSEIEFIT